MSKKTVLKVPAATSFKNAAALRSASSVSLNGCWVAEKKLALGQKVSLSIKAGARRRMFTGVVHCGVLVCGDGCCFETNWSVKRNRSVVKG